MGKGLAVTGIVAAATATLALLVLVGAAALLAVPVLLAGCVVLALQRNLKAVAAAVVVLVLAVFAALGLTGSVTTEGGSTDFGIGEATGRVLAVAGLLAIPVAATLLRWEAVEPRWLAFAGLACAALALLVAILRPDDLVDQSDPLTLAAGALALGAIAPMVGLLRADGDEPVVGQHAP